MTEKTGRTADHAIDPIFLDRWSPRAFTGEAMPQETLLSLFEAARWAPSAANGQPWRFVYGHRGTDAFEAIYQTLDEGNRRWADKAAVLAVIISQTHRKNADGEMRPAYTHAFDTGAAWAYLALQAIHAGYHAHGMGGIDRAKAMDVLDVPESFRVEAAVAIGKIAPKETLPEDLMKREMPSGRKAVEEFVSEGRFSA
ncbi:nitroreductase family protein [Shinella sp. CPCC 100929]|uniref:Nitroreductase family protein n=1 Tax=Shinella lacus TaxID=2654216 RepID=A0ABT1RF62_9HYPH|nr:nitroreductase family protein [Shinella lacus]MCQ4633828.1 nitroreductase family protein [Shinella lacus]